MTTLTHLSSHISPAGHLGMTTLSGISRPARARLPGGVTHAGHRSPHPPGRGTILAGRTRRPPPERRTIHAGRRHPVPVARRGAKRAGPSHRPPGATTQSPAIQAGRSRRPGWTRPRTGTTATTRPSHPAPAHQQAQTPTGPGHTAPNTGTTTTTRPSHPAPPAGRTMTCTGHGRPAPALRRPTTTRTGASHHSRGALSSRGDRRGTGPRTRGDRRGTGPRTRRRGVRRARSPYRPRGVL